MAICQPRVLPALNFGALLLAWLVASQQSAVEDNHRYIVEPSAVEDNHRYIVEPSEVEDNHRYIVKSSAVEDNHRYTAEPY